jgi:hypothetical protein
MKTVMLPAIACVSLAIGACGTTPSTGTGSGTSATGQPGAAATSSSSAVDTPGAASPAAAGAAPARRQFELAPGTAVSVRTTRALSTVRDRAKDTFEATLDDAVLVNDVEVLPRGTRFTGHVTASDESGRLEGHAVLSITLDSFEYKGQTYPVVTSVDTKASQGHKKRNITAVGGGAGLGALIGGIAGGGKGVAIGAAVGAGAGTGAAAATGKQDVEIPAETRFRFTLKDAVTVAE